MGSRLLNYLSRPNVRQFGVTIQGEAVVQGERLIGERNRYCWQWWELLGYGNNAIQQVRVQIS